MRVAVACLAMACRMVAGGCPAYGDEPAGVSSQRFLAEGRDGLVVGLTGKRAVHSGLEILKQGGGAADAAMATAMAQVVEVAGSTSASPASSAWCITTRRRGASTT